MRGAGGATVAREGKRRAAGRRRASPRARSSSTTSSALREALAPGDVACVIAEPAMTNMGIILPDPGYHDELRALTRAGRDAADPRRDAHVLGRAARRDAASGASSRTCSRIGKAIARRRAGRRARPVARASPTRILGDPRADLEDTGGVGGTLAGNALSLAATRAALDRGADRRRLRARDRDRHRLREGIEGVIAAHDLPWHVQQLGARVEYRFSPDAAARRHRVARDPGAGARALPAPARAQPRRPDHALPQHAARVPRDDGSGRRPAHRGLRRGGEPAPLGSAALARRRRRAAARAARRRSRAPRPCSAPRISARIAATCERPPARASRAPASVSTA